MSAPARSPYGRQPRSAGDVAKPNVVSNAEALELVRRDFEAASRALDTTDAIEHLCKVVINMIGVRTNAGLDVRGEAFAPYSGYWACIREKKGLPTDRVTLRFFGLMLESLEVTIQGPRRATIWVRPNTGGGNRTPRDIVGQGHQEGAGRLPKREWFGVSPTQRRVLERELMAFLTEALIANSPRLDPVGDSITVLQDRYEMQRISGATADYKGISALGCRPEHHP